MSRLFGAFSLAPKASTEKQVADLKASWTKANDKNIKQLQHYKELVKFTNTLSDSYINSVRVIVDVSSLLNSYNDLLDEISRGLSQLENTIDTSMKSSEIEQLKNLTLSNIEKINQTFTSGYDRISKAIAVASPSHLGALEDTRSSISRLNTSGVRSTLSQSGGSKRPKNKVRRSKKKNI